MRVAAGSVDQSVVIRIVDDVAGTPEEGVTSASGGLALWYWRMGGVVTALTESDLAAIDSAHADGGIKHADDGYYRVDIPDAAFAANAARVTIGGTVTGMVVIGVVVEIGPVVANAVQVEGSDATDAITAAATASLNTYDPPTKTELDAGLAGSDDATLTAIATVEGKIDTIDNLLDTEMGALITSVAAILADTGTDGVVVAAASKTGYALAATGLDSIPMTAPSGPATTFREALVQTWRRWFKRSVLNTDDGEIITYADNGTTVITTQVVSDDGTEQVVGAAT